MKLFFFVNLFDQVNTYDSCKMSNTKKIKIINLFDQIYFDSDIIIRDRYLHIYEGLLNFSIDVCNIIGEYCIREFEFEITIAPNHIDIRHHQISVYSNNVKAGIIFFKDTEEKYFRVISKSGKVLSKIVPLLILEMYQICYNQLSQKPFESRYATYEIIDNIDPSYQIITTYEKILYPQKKLDYAIFMEDSKIKAYCNFIFVRKDEYIKDLFLAINCIIEKFTIN